jgi:hypothetical protein
MTSEVEIDDGDDDIMPIMMMTMIKIYALKIEAAIPPNCWYIFTRLHGVTAQKITIVIQPRRPQLQ